MSMMESRRSYWSKKSTLILFKYIGLGLQQLHVSVTVLNLLPLKEGERVARA